VPSKFMGVILIRVSVGVLLLNRVRWARSGKRRGKNLGLLGALIRFLLVSWAGGAPISDVNNLVIQMAVVFYFWGLLWTLLL